MRSAPHLWSDSDLDLLSHIYELQSTSLTNEGYYRFRLQTVQSVAFWMELAIAITASGSGVASLLPDLAGSDHPGLQASLGYLWKFLLLVAAIVSIVRPIYAPGKKIEHLTRQLQGYSTNYFALTKLAFAVSQDRSVNGETRRRYEAIFDRHVKLNSDDETMWNGKLLAKAGERTDKVLPKDGFWWPKGAERGTEAPIETLPEVPRAHADAAGK